MNYQNPTPFVKHSHTSKASARHMDESGAADSQAGDICRRLKILAAIGATADEMTIWLKENGYSKIHNGTVAGRLVHLEKNGLIVKTGITRKTTAGRQAWVYVGREFKDLCPPCPEPALPKERKGGAADLGAVRAALEPFTRLPAGASAPALYHHITLTGPELQALRDLAEQVCGAE